MQQRSRPLGGCTRAAGVGRGPRAARAWSSAGEPGPGVLLRVNAVCSGGGNFEPVRRQEVCASQRRTMPLMMTQMVGKWCLKCPLWSSKIRDLESACRTIPGHILAAGATASVEGRTPHATGPEAAEPKAFERASGGGAVGTGGLLCWAVAHAEPWRRRERECGRGGAGAPG
jgi:hypothetical protein